VIVGLIEVMGPLDSVELMMAWKVRPELPGAAIAENPGSRLIWLPAMNVVCDAPLMTNTPFAAPDAVIELVADFVVVPDDHGLG
jgi:hypothetical protein